MKLGIILVFIIISIVLWRSDAAEPTTVVDGLQTPTAPKKRIQVDDRIQTIPIEEQIWNHILNFPRRIIEKVTNIPKVFDACNA